MWQKPNSREIESCIIDSKQELLQKKDPQFIEQRTLEKLFQTYISFPTLYSILHFLCCKAWQTCQLSTNNNLPPPQAFLFIMNNASKS